MRREAAQHKDCTLTLPDWVDDFYHDKTDYRSFYCTKGLGAGGTYGGVLWHVLMCFENNKSPLSWAIAPTYQQVADTLIPTFAEVLSDEFELEEGIDYSIVVSNRPRLILHLTGQEIHFKSANRPDRLVGPSISHILGTEPGLWDKVAFEKSEARLRCKRAKRRQKLYEGTPEGLGNAYELRANFDEGVNQERNARRAIVKTSHNLHLPGQYVESLNSTYAYDPAKLESYVNGLFVSFAKGSAYWEFRESRNVTLGVKASEYLPLIFNWDFGTSPLAWVGAQMQPVTKKNGERVHRFVALAEGSGNARGLMDACAEFVDAFPPHEFSNTPIWIHGGHDGFFGSHLSDLCAYDQIYNYLKRYYRIVEIRAARKAPEIKDRLERVNALFLYERYVIAAWCRNLIKSHSQSNLKDGTWKLEKKKDNDLTHFSDSVGDALMQLFRDTDLESPMTKRIYGVNR